jgi:alkanesulfonate monooxygenase SsuD/methylene tetrahydromethanopterin reductase-like flavin-dependent oxidoreductase (luciferase family)
MEFALQGSGRYDTLVFGARWAEERGLVCLALPDHYVMSLSGTGPPAYDAFIQLAGLARETSSIELSVLVSPITFRHPAVIAKSAFTIDALSGGRFTLGIGTGWLEIEHQVFGIPFPPLGERFDRMEEGLAYVRALAAGEAFEGRHYALEAGDLNPKPSEGFTIVVGGRGSHRTPILAGRYADEYNVYPAEPAEMRSRIELARGAAVEAGRDPDALLISSAGAVLVGHDQADYEERFAAAAAEGGITVDELEAHFALRNTPRGPADAVRDQLATMAGLGVGRFYLQAGDLDDLDSIDETLTMIGG